MDKIVGHEVRRGKYYFVVRWKGYTEKDDTLEPEKNLNNCESILKDYKTSLVSKKRKLSNVITKVNRSHKKAKTSETKTK